MTKETATRMFAAMGWTRLHVAEIQPVANMIDCGEAWNLHYNDNTGCMYLHNLQDNTWWKSKELEIDISLFISVREDKETGHF